MKSVLISIQPKWCELIASGKKTVEVRRKKPKLETPFKVYIYCTEGKLKDLGIIGNKIYHKRMKVIGEFVCDRIEEIGFSPYNHGEYICKDPSFVKQSCVPFDVMFDYLGERYGYGWHISDLVIYDKPRELKEFLLSCTGNERPLRHPPMSWCYVESEVAI